MPAIAPLFAALFLSFSAAPAEAQALPAEFAGRRSALVQRAREAQFAERWAQADETDRALARTHLRALFDKGRVGAPTSIERARALGEAWRLLLPGSDDPASIAPGARLVDAIDLSVVPGSFSARDEGRGEALTVYVRTLYEVPIDAQVELSLDWISLEDGSRVRARSESIVPEAFDKDGFDMYLRPPRSAPGRYLLVPELTVGGDRYHGFATFVDCAARLGQRTRALDERAAQGDGLAFDVRDVLAPRLTYGMRELPGVSVEDLLSIALDDAQPRSAVRALRAVEGSGLPLLWSRAAVSEARPRVLLIATDELEHPAQLLAGKSGRAWEELAAELDAQLLVTDLPALTMGGGRDLVDLLRTLRFDSSVTDLWLVARGETGVLIPARLRAPDESALVDRLLVCASIATRRAPRFGVPFPVLSIDDLALTEENTSGGEEGAVWTWQRRIDPEPTFAPELPAIFGAWLSSLESGASGGDAPR